MIRAWHIPGYLGNARFTVFERLNKQRAHLISPPAQSELIKRIQDYGPRTPSFTVAEEIGLFEDCLILPDGTVPALPNGVEAYLSDIPAEFISKYKCAGTREGWLELARYAIGNTRMMFAFAMNFVGPVSAMWPRQSVTVHWGSPVATSRHRNPTHLHPNQPPHIC